MIIFYIIGAGYVGLLIFSWYWYLKCGGALDQNTTTTGKFLFIHGLCSALFLIFFVVWTLASTAGNLLALDIYGLKY